MYINYKLHLSLLFPFRAWKFMLLTRKMTSFARQWRKIVVFFQFKVFLRNRHTTYYWPRQGNQKGPLSKHFFPFLMLFLTSSMDHMKFQSNWLWKKILKVKVYMKGTVRNDMFIRMAEPPLLVKFQNSLQPT